MRFLMIPGLFVFLFIVLVPKGLHAQKAEPEPLAKGLLKSRTASLPAQQTQGTLTLRKAVSLALRHNPQLTAFSLEIRAREAATLQTGLWPNPELDAETENFAGSGSFTGFKATESTISLGQLIELGGKRHKRTQVARLQGTLASWDYESRKLDVFMQVVSAFYKVLAAQEQIRLNTEILSLAEAFQAQIDRRVRAGRVSPAELSRAQVETTRARMALQFRKKTLLAAREELAATWGAPAASFKRAVGILDTVIALPPLAKLNALLEQNPDLARWPVIKKQRRMQLELARAQAIPDPRLSFGWRRFTDSGNHALVAGVSLPLPLFNRNQGGVQEAAVRITQTEWQEKAARIERQSTLRRIYQYLTATLQMVTMLKSEIIPRAQQAFDTIDRGYRQGKFGFLEVLDARRTLFSARQGYLQHLAEYQQKRAQIERLIGQSLETIK